MLLIRKWMSLFLRKNNLLRCCGWLSLLNWIGALTRGWNNRFSNARLNLQYYQIFTGHLKNPPDIMFGFTSSNVSNLSTCYNVFMATFCMHKYSFCKISTYRVNKPCINFFYFFFITSTAKSLIKHTRWRVPMKGK